MVLMGDTAAVVHQVGYVVVVVQVQNPRPFLAAMGSFVPDKNGFSTSKVVGKPAKKDWKDLS